MKRFPPLSVAATVVSGLCFSYFMICGFCRSFSLSGLWIWLLFSLILAGCVLIRAVAEPKISESRGITVYRRLKSFFLLMSAIFLSIFLIFEILVSLTWVKGTNTPRKDADVIIVLGATVEYDAPAPTLEKRIRTAAAYGRVCPDSIIITCGGLGDGDIITEAQCIKRELVALGINEERIITEDSSTSTSENFRFAVDHIPESARSVAVVSSGFHLFRASVIAQSTFEEKGLSLSFIPVAAPSADISLPCSMVREFAAIVRGFLSGDIVF